MAKVCYNSCLTPEIPKEILDEYPYCIIAINQSSEQYQLCASKTKWFFSGNEVTRSDNEYVPYYYCYEGDTSWTYGSSENYTFNVYDRPLVWTSVDIPHNSVSSTNIYFYSTDPLKEGCFSGCVLTEDGSSLSESSGNFVLGNDFLCKKSVVALGARIVAPAAQVQNKTSMTVILWDSKGQVVAETNSFILYDSDRWVNIVFKEKVDLVEGEIYTIGANFKSYYYTPSTSSGAIDFTNELEFVQSRYAQLTSTSYPTTVFNDKMYGVIDILYETDEGTISGGLKYLIRISGTIFTITDSGLTPVTGELNAALFKSQGFDVIPVISDWSTIPDPELLTWTDDGDNVPVVTAIMSATASPQTLYAEPFYLTDATIAGIDSVTCEYEGSPLIALSFNGGAYEYYNNGWANASDTEGMLPDVLTAITSDVWEAKVAGVQSVQIRVILNTNADTLQTVKFKFINEKKG